MTVAALAAWLAIAERADSLHDAAAALRAALPASMRVLPMDAIDLRDEQPALRGERRTLFLGASDGHCVSMTTDLRAAAVLFVADTAVAGG